MARGNALLPHDLLITPRENKRESESMDGSWDMWISQKLFLDRKSNSPDVSDYLGWRHMNVSSIVGSLLEPCSSSIKPSGLLETRVYIVYKLCRNWRICLQLQNLGQDKPIFFLLKPFLSNKRLFHSGGHVEFSNFAKNAGTRLPFSWHLWK